MDIKASDDILCLLQQQHPILVLESDQEKEALELLHQHTRSTGSTLYRWTLTSGLQPLTFGLSLEMPPVSSEQTPEDVLKDIAERHTDGVFVLCDFHPFLTSDNPRIIRLMKDIALSFDQLQKRLVLLSHRLSLPPELRSYAAVGQLSLPSDDEILNIIREQARRFATQSRQKRIRTDSAALNALVAGMRGVTKAQVARLAWRAIADDGAITMDDLKEVNSAKFALLNQDGLLHYEYDTQSFAEVGGLPNLKQWLSQRQQAFTASEIDAPKGLLLLGVQGGGKSLAAKAVAGHWGLPLLRLDMGSLYNKYIGETEKNLRESLQQAELMSPCVLWMDELEKAMAQGGSDDGLSRRLLGHLLTWMSERKGKVFMVATSNDISRLPAELVRKGRFDEIFFVDLPDEAVRPEIFKIHLEKRGIDTTEMGWTRLAVASEGFSGAEIEQSVVSALYRLDEGETLSEDHLLEALLSTSPLSVVMAEQLQALRDWAADRAVSA